MHALGREVVRWLRRRTTVLRFHADFIVAAFADDIQEAALSVPRGSAKTWIAGQLAAAGITPGSPLWEPHIETLVVSGSLEQSRVMLAFVKEALGDDIDEYRVLDSGQRLAVTHKATGTRLRVLSSSGKRAMGLANFSTIYADEPASWEVRGGELMYDALRQSLGKRPGQRLVLIGTRAPAPDGSWWPGLLDAGSGPGVHVTVRSAPEGEPWDAWPTIRKVNPLVMHNADLRATILRERDRARIDPTRRPSFEAYRLNRQIAETASRLVPLGIWQAVERREVPPRTGRPIVGMDLGAERSWTAAWCLWPNGRSECYAVCPGIPDLADREKADAQPAGMYQRLAADGVFVVDENHHRARPELLVEHLVSEGIRPEVVIADRFNISGLRDAVGGRWPIRERVTRWSEATDDIAGFRSLAADGPLSVAPQCRALARFSMREANVKTDDQGNCRLEKRSHARSRDDVAVAGVLAAGELARRRRRPAKRPARRMLTG